jgi:hypothetical protein
MYQQSMIAKIQTHRNIDLFGTKLLSLVIQLVPVAQIENVAIKRLFDE